MIRGEPNGLPSRFEITGPVVRGLSCAAVRHVLPVSYLLPDCFGS